MDIPDHAPIMIDVVNTVMSKYRSDILKDKNSIENQLNEKHQKIKNAMDKENLQIDNIKTEITKQKDLLKKYKIEYITQKVNIKTKTKIIDEQKEKNQNLITIYNAKIQEYNAEQFKINNLIEDIQHQYLKDKHTEDNKLNIEIDIFKQEVERIKLKKQNIENELHNQLSVMVNDLELYDKKINNKQHTINLLKSEINNIEKGNCFSRRQIIKNNKLYINKNKTLRKIKNNLQYQIANYNLEIYVLETDYQNELTQLKSKNEIDENKYRNNINQYNEQISILTKEASLLKTPNTNVKSKTWQVNYKKYVDKTDELHHKLTQEIKAFNIYLGDYQNKLIQLNNKYKYSIEVKQKDINMMQTKLDRLNKAQDNKISKMSRQHQLNNKIIKEKTNLLNNEYNEIQQLRKQKYDQQQMSQKYESDTNRQIAKLGNELERAQERLNLSLKRFQNQLDKHQHNNQLINNKYQNQLNEIHINISHCHQTLKQLENTYKHSNKDFKTIEKRIKELRTLIKDTERTIKDKEKQLDVTIIKVNKRIEIMQQKENNVIDEKIKNDLDYVTKLNQVDQLEDKSLNHKIEVLNKLMDIKIEI